jgi:hypothetical protein
MALLYAAIPFFILDPTVVPISFGTILVAQQPTVDKGHYHIFRGQAKAARIRAARPRQPSPRGDAIGDSTTPESPAAVISATGQFLPHALQKKFERPLPQGRTCSPHRDRLSTMQLKR